jgi:hypothetical protein
MTGPTGSQVSGGGRDFQRKKIAQQKENAQWGNQK